MGEEESGRGAEWARSRVGEEQSGRGREWVRRRVDEEQSGRGGEWARRRVGEEESGGGGGEWGGRRVGEDQPPAPPPSAPPCPAHSLCVNTESSYACVCRHGYYDVGAATPGPRDALRRPVCRGLHVATVTGPSAARRLTPDPPEHGVFSRCAAGRLAGGVSQDFLRSRLGGDVSLLLNDGRCKVEEHAGVYSFSTPPHSSPCGTARTVRRYTSPFSSLCTSLLLPLHLPLLLPLHLPLLLPLHLPAPPSTLPPSPASAPPCSSLYTSPFSSLCTSLLLPLHLPLLLPLHLPAPPSTPPPSPPSAPPCSSIYTPPFSCLCTFLLLPLHLPAPQSTLPPSPASAPPLLLALHLPLLLPLHLPSPRSTPPPSPPSAPPPHPSFCPSCASLQVNETHIELRNTLRVTLRGEEPVARGDLLLVWACVFPRRAQRTAQLSTGLDWRVFHCYNNHYQ
ncbi:hypothetical protein N1851_029569 [Merluccius polli]|uniref:EGF-like domain-containing protein n=1 Tax=Merluccius polli TaxID=89951 RepID=A0AA47M6Y5_MERPO|nr:hypothetical protein N1851_029569 [Merluccius polli]